MLSKTVRTSQEGLQKDRPSGEAQASMARLWLDYGLLAGI
jgi:hypothetical protein